MQNPLINVSPTASSHYAKASHIACKVLHFVTLDANSESAGYAIAQEDNPEGPEFETGSSRLTSVVMVWYATYQYREIR